MAGCYENNKMNITNVKKFTNKVAIEILMKKKQPK